MITINGVTFREISGELDPCGFQSENISQNGYDFQYYRIIGKRSDISVIQVMIDFNSSSTANAAFLTYKSYEGTQVPVIVSRSSNEPIVYPCVIIHKVRKIKEEKTGLISGNIRNSSVLYGATILILEFSLQVNS